MGAVPGEARGGGQVSLLLPCGQEPGASSEERAEMDWYSSMGTCRLLKALLVPAPGRSAARARAPLGKHTLLMGRVRKKRGM